MSARGPTDNRAPEALLGPGRSRWRSLIGTVLMLAGAAFLLRVLLRSAPDLVTLSWQPSPRTVMTSFGCLLLCLGCGPLIWQRLLRDFQHRLGYRDAFAIHYVVALAKYLPGSVWGFVGMAHYARRLHLSTRTTVSSALVEQAVVSGGSVLMFGASLLLWPRSGSAHRLIAGGLWAVGLLVLLSPLLARMLSSVAGRGLRESTAPRFTRAGLLVALGYYFLSMVPFVVGYYYLLQGFYPTSFKDVLIFTGLYAISWLAGFVAVFVPSGLGVRDSLQAYLLSWFVPPAVAVTITLVQRVWLTIGDLMSGLLALWLLRRRR
jgi:hypothetical protein